jgi:hypothetical protein
MWHLWWTESHWDGIVCPTMFEPATDLNSVVMAFDVSCEVKMSLLTPEM